MCACHAHRLTSRPSVQRIMWGGVRSHRPVTLAGGGGDPNRHHTSDPHHPRITPFATAPPAVPPMADQYPMCDGMVHAREWLCRADLGHHHVGRERCAGRTGAAVVGWQLCGSYFTVPTIRAHGARRTVGGVWGVTATPQHCDECTASGTFDLYTACVD